MQSEFGYRFERRAWPSGEPVATAPLRLPMGWPVEVRCHPRGGLAAVAWRDQCESGVELVEWDAQACRQQSTGGYLAQSNWNSPVAFCPDGRFLVVAIGSECWWSEDPEEPSAGGRLKAGWVVIGDLERRQYREVNIFVTLPRGWIAPDPNDLADLNSPSAPVFSAGNTFSLELPKGCQHVLTTAGDILAEPSLSADS
jgi:hypothetical protein